MSLVGIEIVTSDAGPSWPALAATYALAGVTDRLDLQEHGGIAAAG